MCNQLLSQGEYDFYGISIGAIDAISAINAISAIALWKMGYWVARSCQKATAAAAATLSESTWCDMGMRAT